MDAILSAIRQNEFPEVLERMVLFYFYDQLLVMDKPASKAIETAREETRIFMSALDLPVVEPSEQQESSSQ